MCWEGCFGRSVCWEGCLVAEGSTADAAGCACPAQGCRPSATAQAAPVDGVGRPPRASSPDGGGGNVAIAVQSLARGAHVLRAQLQLLLYGVDHATPTGVDAEVLKGQLKVGDVGPHALESQELRGRWGGGRVGGPVKLSKEGVSALLPGNVNVSSWSSCVLPPSSRSSCGQPAKGPSAFTTARRPPAPCAPPGWQRRAAARIWAAPAGPGW